MEKDLYEILGVTKTAKEGEIRKAFLKLAKKYHPDVNSGDNAAEQKFKEVNLAYEVLKDAKKRAQYDQARAMGANPFARNAQTAGAGAHGGFGGFGPESFKDFGLGDLFEEIFGQAAGARGGPRGHRGHGPFQQRAQRGVDREAELTVSFQEAALGGERSVEFSDGRRLTVKIPAGIDEGSKIKLSGQGEFGLAGGPRGDLLVTLHVSSHPYFRREGLDIVVKVPVSVTEAILGAEIEVPTLTGKVHLRVPSGVSSGQRMKLSGKGILKSGRQGDQYVELSIRLPKPLPDSYKAAAETLSETKFDPRSGLFD